MTILKVIGFVTFIVLMLMSGKIFSGAIRAYENAECLTWLDQQRDYPGWYSTDWQRAQCIQYGIKFFK